MKFKDLILTGCFILCFWSLYTSSSFAAQDCSSKGKVLAFYYGWYASPPFDNGDWSRIGSRIGDTPSLGSYGSETISVIHQHVDEARAHGIDGFILSWVGTYPGNPGPDKSDQVLRELLSYSASRGDFCVAVDFEPLFMRNNLHQSDSQIIAHMNYLLSTHSTHARFLKILNKPAIFFWKNENFPDTFWRSMRSSMTRPAYLISEAGGSRNCVSVVIDGIFDNCHYYSVFWMGKLNPEKKKNPQEVIWDAIHKNEARFGTITPGYSDGHSAGSGRWATGTHDMYVDHWKFILRTVPDYVLITSYNEWPEATYIEKSNKFGDLYLRITKEGVGKYKAKL